MYAYPFEKLIVWQLSKKLALTVYQLTEKFPTTEKFGLVMQMRRAAISISSNIAEGSGRQTKKDQAHFYNLSYSSLMELLNHLLIAAELKWIEEEDLFDVRNKMEIISLKLNALRISVLRQSA